MRTIDLSGRKVGRLTVLSLCDIRGSRGELYWNCECDCGLEARVRGDKLRGGHTISCGCAVRPDLSGKKFHRLLAVRPGENKGQFTTWVCACDCGNEAIIDTYSLTSGATKSCGCYKREVSSVNGKKRRKEYGLAAFNTILSGYKTRARTKGLSFELSRDEFKNIIQGDCFYCGALAAHRPCLDSKHGGFSYSGIDRLDSSLGYTIENSVPCCTRCNRGKLDLSIDDFLAWIVRVHDHMKEKASEC